MVLPEWMKLVTDDGISQPILIKPEDLIAKAQNTKFGKDHNFSAIRTYEDFAKDMERDKFMSAEEALEYGLIDKIVEKRD
jgi:ATP-dependent Clp protease protease subunit